MSDWGSDEEGPKTNGGFGGTANGGFGFGRGRGLGRGAFGGDSDAPKGLGSKGDGDGGGFGGRGGGFGSRGGRGGFGGRQDDESGDANGDSGGFGSRGGGGGGFGSRGGGGGGFGSRGGGFGSRNDDEPRGGGFGDRKGGSGCHKCGEEGHFARECPSGGGGGGGGGRGSGCHKCGEEGHFARECPSGGGGGGGGGRGCHKCGEEGHFARECPSGGGGGGGNKCYKCDQEGHFARECPNADSSGGGGGGSRGCYKCGEDGHIARDCPQGGGDGGSRGKGCFKCGKEGHMSRECPDADDGDVGDGVVKKTEIYVPPPPPDTEEEIFKTIEAGINFDKYENIPVEVSGKGAPERGISSFDEAEFPETIRSNIRKAHYEKPTPIQKWAIPIVLSGRDLMGCAQTGSGKTAAFLLPILCGIVKNDLLSSSSGFGGPQTPAAIIVGPTRELVNQIYTEARKFARSTIVRPVVVYGGTSVGHQAREVEKGANIVAGTPGRLLDFIEKGKISLAKVKYLILDEADRMLDMGFEPEIRKLIDNFGLPAKEDRQTLMFSATFPNEIQTLARQYLNEYLFVTVGRVGGANSDITQTIMKVSQYEKRDTLVKLLNESGTDRTLVFLERKRQADFLAAYLSQSQFPATSIHGDRLQREREEALADFKSGRAPILIATSVAARGLDIPGVMHVINYDLPNNIEEYVHRIGRTGRCGNLGKATSFFDGDADKDIARSLVTTLADAQQEVPSWLEEVATESFGTGFHGAGGSFGGKDTRGGGKFRKDDDSGFSNGGGFGGGFSSSGGGGGGGGDDEDWD